MTRMTISKMAIFALMLLLLLGITSSLTIAEASKGSGELDINEYQNTNNLDSAEPTPGSVEEGEGDGLTDISSTAAITVSLGAWLSLLGFVYRLTA